MCLATVTPLDLKTLREIWKQNSPSETNQSQSVVAFVPHLLASCSMLTTLFPLVALFSVAAVQDAHAQVVVNGQIYTKGLAIVDAPQPGT